MDLENLLSDEYKNARKLRNAAKKETESLMAGRGGRMISWDEWVNMRGNSYFQEEILPFLDSDALAKHGRQCLNQCSLNEKKMEPSEGYEEFLLERLLPVMIERLKVIEN